MGVVVTNNVFVAMIAKVTPRFSNRLMSESARGGKQTTAKVREYCMQKRMHTNPLGRVRLENFGGDAHVKHKASFRESGDAKRWTIRTSPNESDVPRP